MVKYNIIRLHGVDRAVEALLFHELLVNPPLNDSPLVEYQDDVRFHEALDAVGDDEGGSPSHQLFQGAAYLHLRLHVHRGSGVVDDENLRILEQGPGRAGSPGRWRCAASGRLKA